MYQPVILSHHGSEYFELPPHPALKELIQTFWVSPVGDSHHRVLPDFCGDIILVFSQNLRLEKLFFSTPQTDYFIFEGNEDDIIVGIRFYLQGFPLILEYPLAGQKNDSLSNSEYFADFSAFIKRYEKFPSLSSLLNQLDTYFLNKLSERKSLGSEIFLNNFIKNASSNLTYKEVIRKEVISERSIQRKFKEEIALSPYELYDTIRFQNVLQEIQKGQKSFIDVTYAYHFHDQAHFSKTVKKYSGLSPRQILFACRNYTSNT
ncbi:helix-turn-helix domain-containing protein [Vagococcus elongatus]|uniref:HTH araC/xylS-type domain-containing protein n=1 Tax=Vagococcus elongatus TaxID=180344 RepID=A0A430B5X6_9ENTE|nr:helix-turn-helix transcriptional regulator [Vagococcus elongatus]RSU15708.1 hypothetical protein CBF29_01145 [Vagococcus elongatus]